MVEKTDVVATSDRENPNKENTDLSRICHIYDSNEKLLQKTDTKVGIFLASNAIIISIIAGLDPTEYNSFPRIFIISAVVCAGFSSLTLILSILPKASPSNTVIFHTGILKNSKEKYISDVTKISNDDLYKQYADSVYEIAKIQERRHSYMKLGLILLFVALSLIILSFILKE